MPVVVAVIGHMGLIDHRGREDVCVAKVPATRMGGVGAGAAAGGEVGKLRGLGIDRVVVAETRKRHILWRSVPIEPAVEGVVLVG